MGGGGGGPQSPGWQTPHAKQPSENFGRKIKNRAATENILNFGIATRVSGFCQNKSEIKNEIEIRNRRGIDLIANFNSRDRTVNGVSSSKKGKVPLRSTKY